ncbi:MAG: hydroxyacid dehydrogenase [Clostridiales Family XIII bacterium]|nr:hydroxyacid dehydrogenase [Clostridiales Family XIII bacterium]
MQKIKAIVGTEILPEFLDRIKQYYDITFLPWLGTDKLPTEDEIIRHCKGYEVVVVYTDRITERCIKALSQAGLKFLGCGRATPNNIDWKAAKEYGIPIIHTPGRNAHAVAEYTVGMLLALCKRIAFTYNALQDGRFLAEAKDIYDIPKKDDVIWRFAEKENPRSSFPWSIDVFGRTVGIVGLGAIGQNVAKICRGMGMQVLAYDPYQRDEAFAESEATKISDVFDMLPQCDFICVNLAPSPETYGLIDKKWFGAMRNDAYFINTSRASVVKQKDLIDALTHKVIAFAALDVMWEEPAPENHPLLHMDNVLITPHMAGISADVKKWASFMLADELLRYAEKKENIRIWKRT